MEGGDLNKVWEIKVKNKARQDEARKILERIAKQVQPIMRKHNWHVKLLTEMYRKDYLGLNFDAGGEVKLTLRTLDNELEFLPFDEVLDTMLHELCHNDHDYHNASFYTLWDQLRKECEELMGKGIIFPRHYPIPTQSLRLGGDKTIMTSLSPAQAAARAAERRLKDEIWCATVLSGMNAKENSSSNSRGSGITGKRSKGGKLIDFTSDLPSTSGVGKRFRGTGASSSSPFNNAHLATKPGDSVTWICETCTLLNPDLALVCEACETLRPEDVTVTYKFWTCIHCTLENNISQEKCSACHQWRYAGSPPSSSLPLNLRA